MNIDIVPGKGVDGIANNVESEFPVYRAPDLRGLFHLNKINID